MQITVMQANIYVKESPEFTSHNSVSVTFPIQCASKAESAKKHSDGRKKQLIFSCGERAARRQKRHFNGGSLSASLPRPPTNQISNFSLRAVGTRVVTPILANSCHVSNCGSSAPVTAPHHPLIVPYVMVGHRPPSFRFCYYPYFAIRRRQLSFCPFFCLTIMHIFYSDTTPTIFSTCTYICPPR